MIRSQMVRRAAWMVMLVVITELTPAHGQEYLSASADESVTAAGQAGQVDEIDAADISRADLDRPQSDRWLVLMCGLPGDGDHRERLTDAVRRIASAAESVLHVDRNRLVVMVADETMATDVSDAISGVTVCTRQSVETGLSELGARIGQEDSCWLMLLGHAQLYNGRSTFNILGPDFDAAELAGWMKPIQCRQRVYWVTMPVSGFWLKPLSGPGTASISATDIDLEITGTEMPYALAAVISGQGNSQQLEDVDGDQQLSLLDLYLAVNLEIHGRFKSLDRLQTEHAQLDDNGDGSGSEVQTPYLPVEPAEGEALVPESAKPPVPTRNRDGDYSRSILIGPPPAAANATEAAETVEDTAESP